MFDFLKNALERWKAAQRPRPQVLSYEGGGRVCLSPEALEELVRSPGFRANIEALREIEASLMK